MVDNTGSQQNKPKLFPDAEQGLQHFGQFTAGEKAEFIELVIKQLQTQEFGLVSSFDGGGIVLVKLQWRHIKKG